MRRGKGQPLGVLLYRRGASVNFARIRSMVLLMRGSHPRCGHRAPLTYGLCLTVLLLACRPRASDRSVGDPSASGLDSAQVVKMAHGLVDVMAQFRGLQGSQPLTVETMSGDEVKRRAERAIRAAHSQDELDRTRRIEVSLGFRPGGRSVDGPAGSVSVAVGGMYDHISKALWIDATGEAEQLEWMVAHEVVHYLQDSNFDLGRLTAPIPGDSDAELARNFLVEGDAQAACFAWETKDRTLRSTSPETLRDQGDQVLDSEGVFDYPVIGCINMLPYNYAASTVVQTVRERGWASVDELFRDPPSTSEQMLHPEKMLIQEKSIPISVNTTMLQTALPGALVVRQDTLGEAKIFCMLAAVVSSAQARAAAAGWGGDRILVLETDQPDSAPVVIGLIAWDELSEAAEFEPVFRQYLETTSRGRYAMQRRDSRVVFVLQLPSASAKRLSEAAWAMFHVE